MNNLTKVKATSIRPIRRRRIEKLTRDNFGHESEKYVRIMRACDRVVKEYRGKKRKNGEARIIHERRMFVQAIKSGIRDVEILVAIFAHDLHEDYRKEWPLSRIVEVFGKEVAEIVAAVTKPPLRGREITSLEFSKAVFAKVSSGGEKAWILKILDRYDYMVSLYGKRERVIGKLYQTMMFVQSKAAELNFLACELQIATSKWVKRLKIEKSEAPWGRSK